MNNLVSKVAVIGSGISGAVCASSLAKNGISVTVFESARGPGGRMSQRREISEDGKEVYFDHGAPFFSVSDTDAVGYINEWKSKGLVAEWKENFGSFDRNLNQFRDFGKEGFETKYVCLPGMNSVCRSLCLEPGVESKFGVGVGRLEWLEDDKLWSLIGLDGQNLGQFEGIVASDKNIVNPRVLAVTGRPPPLDLNLVPEFALKLQEIPVKPCFALMLAFRQPLSLIPAKGFAFKNSKVLSWAFCDSSKPGHSATGESWVLHSTSEYAEDIIAQTGLRKPSNATLRKVAEDLLQEFQSTGFNIPQPFFMKAHRWGSAFPAASIAKEDKCLWDKDKRLAICGDFCVSPNVEGAVLSGMAAASKLTQFFSSL